MVNWHNPTVIAEDSAGFVKAAHFCAGVIIWEIFSTFNYEWRFYSGKRPFRWPILLYAVTRLFALATGLSYLIGLNINTEINCGAWLISTTLFGDLSLITASALLAAAHAIHNGLTAIDNHELHTKMHGEKVSFGIVCQLILDGAPTAELDRYIALLHSVDLPITLGDLGIGDATDAQLRGVAKQSCAPNETIWNMNTPINEDIVFNAIRGADTASKDWLKRTGKAKA
ncbi:hypothetical protein EWM64_g108 [Hericium alpestre]|uniref:Uncharacterized protein n=1 Tax=Hericium alpestre TaxID=135208 RepID=A0A4Z0AAW7_9AGAM|nr:hypothetical protein EWM64_g108 [Hericium alpestre]